MATSTRESYVPIVGELPWTMVYCRTSHEPRHIGKETEEAGATTDQEDAVGDWAVPRPLFTDRLPEAPTLPPIAKVPSHHLLLRDLAVLGDLLLLHHSPYFTLHLFPAYRALLWEMLSMLGGSLVRRYLSPALLCH